ncbi:single-stranded DNA-binding protein [Gorillibacterium sp. sgz5001074]|uniref:single-stranded DNA-binding protein n=1 Tax=Gorillibacterium sp. sgz5001074 TaxID=3446695 RepID=UPI003F67CE0F
MNKVILTGRWTREIDFKALESGKCVSKSALAVDEGYGDQKKSYFFEVEMWGKTAENVANHSGKGRKVLIEGRLKVDTWEKDGQKRSQVKVVAEVVEFLDYKEDGKHKPSSDDPFQDDGKPLDFDSSDLPF